MLAGGIIGAIVGVLVILYGISKRPGIITNSQGQSAPISGTPIIIIGVVLLLGSIGSIIGAVAGKH